MRIAGFLLLVAGLALAVRSALLLAGRGRPRRGEQPALVIAGPYTRVRNPLLLGAIVAMVGLALWAESALLGLATMLAAAGAHAWVVGLEEGRLRERFGPTYADYARHVPRWIPRRRTGA